MLPLRMGESCIKHIKLSPGDRDSIDMACGGDVNLLIEYISFNDIENQAHFAKLINYSHRKVASICVTALDNSSGELILSRGIYVCDGTLKGTLPEWVTEHLKPELLDGVEYSILEISKYKSILLESICQAAQIYIFGGGHVGLKTAQLITFCGQRAVVVDDRPEFLGAERFPDCETYCCPEYRNIFAGRDIGPSKALIIVTRGHRYDLTVLDQALCTKAGYIGMIGSRSKINSSFNTLREKGFGSSDLARVHAPIGLSIGAETPSEIAVSIVSEIITCFCVNSAKKEGIIE